MAYDMAPSRGGLFPWTYGGTLIRGLGWGVIALMLAVVLALAAGCDEKKSPTPASPTATHEPSAESSPESLPPMPTLHYTELARHAVNDDAMSLATPDGRVRVEVSPDTFPQADELVIAQATGPIAAVSEQFTTLGLFDISTAQGTQPHRPVTITLGNVPAADGTIAAAWWHEELQGWISVPTRRDQAKGTVTFEIPHFTLFGWFLQKAGYERRVIGDFEIVWDPKVFELPATFTSPDQLVGKITYKSANDYAQYLKPGENPADYVKLPPMIRDTGVYLNYTLRKFKEAGFKTPTGPILVVIETSMSSENARDKALAIIHIGEYNNMSSQLKLATAHELFHAVQNEYLWSIGGMSYLGWWCEATAEYAGSSVWWPDRPARRPNPRYFSEALTSTQHEHEYQSAHFINTVTGPGTIEERLKKFRKLWEGALAEHGVTDATDILFPMTMYLKAAGQSGVNEAFRDHVYDLYFSPTSPIITPDDTISPLLPVAEMMSGWTLLRSGEKEAAQLKLTLKGSHRAKAWGIKVQPDAGQATREVELELGGPLSGYIMASVHVLVNDQRSDGAMSPTTRFTENGRKVRVTLGPKDAAYVVVINNGGTGGPTYTLDVRDPSKGSAWRLIKIGEAAGDPFIPRAKLLGKKAIVADAADAWFAAWTSPHEDMTVTTRPPVTYQFAAKYAATELQTSTAWQEMVYDDNGKRQVDFAMTITRRWAPTPPPRLKPGERVTFTESIDLAIEPLADWARSDKRPKVTGLMMTRIDRERLGPTTYTHVDSEQYRGKPLRAETALDWTVPQGAKGDRLRITLRAADSGPAGLGQESGGSYMDQYQSAGVVYIYEYVE